MRIAIILVCFAATVAHAQPSKTQPTTSGKKTPATAVFLSVSVPLLGAAAIGASGGSGGAILFGVSALFLGPSTGRWYAGEGGGLTLGVRAVGVLGLGAASVGMYGISESDCRANDQPCHSPVPFQALAIGSATLIVGTWVYDVVQAKRATDRWNANHVTLTPGLVGGTTRAPGLFMTGRF